MRTALLVTHPDERLTSISDKTRSRDWVRYPTRGAIVDREGRTLALSVQTTSVFADPSLIADPRSTAKKLAKPLGMSASVIEKKLRMRNNRFVWLARRLPNSIREAIPEVDFGIGFINEPKRVYPFKSTLAQTIGFLSTDDRGIEGLELLYNQKLAGDPQKLSLGRDAKGRPLFTDPEIYERRSLAEDLELTIDIDVQSYLEKELSRVIKEFEAESAVGVVLDVETSELLSVANLPSYDLNRPFSASASARRNRVFLDVFEPGSTLKAMLVGAGMRSGAFAPNTIFDCEGGKFQVGKAWIREADSNKGWGNLSVAEILAKSSNIGSVKMAFRLGAKPYFEALTDFGFGQLTGVGFPGESVGILHPLPWSKSLLSTAAFGHGVAATAGQIANAFATVARGGLWKPMALVKGKAASLERSAVSSSGRRVLTVKEAEMLTMMLRSATLKDGTGSSASVPGFAVAGKTGTAQKVNPEGRGYLPGKYLSSFAGFFPSHNPKYVIYVMVDSPKSAYYASQVAAPVFSKVASFVARKHGLVPSHFDSDRVVTKERVPLVAETMEIMRRHREIRTSLEQRVMPDLKGLSVGDFVQISKNRPLKIRGQGEIVKTRPPAGDVLNGNQAIELILREPEFSKNQARD